MSQMAHKFDPSILREYDIRGIVGETVHAATTEIRASETLFIEYLSRWFGTGDRQRRTGPNDPLNTQNRG